MAAPLWHPDLDRLACLRGREVEVRELTGGLSNRTLRVTATDGGTPLDVVVRLPSASPLGSPPATEHRNTLAAAATGTGPPVVELVPPDGPLAVAHLDARALGPEEVRADLGRVAALCRRLHDGPHFDGELDLATVVRRYQQRVEEHGGWRPAGHGDLAPVVARILAALRGDPVPTVPCHNDLPGGNILDDGRRLWLVDFEFAAQSEPWYELGNLASGAALAPEEVEELVTAYDGAARAGHLARTRLWSSVCSWTWVLWASLQDVAGEVEHDFRTMATELHERAREGLSSPDLDLLLAQAADPARGSSRTGVFSPPGTASLAIVEKHTAPPGEQARPPT